MIPSRLVWAAPAPGAPVRRRDLRRLGGRSYRIDDAGRVVRDHRRIGIPRPAHAGCGAVLVGWDARRAVAKLYLRAFEGRTAAEIDADAAVLLGIGHRSAQRIRLREADCSVSTALRIAAVAMGRGMTADDVAELLFGRLRRASPEELGL